MKSVLFFMCSFVIVGCGGSNGGSPSPPPPAPVVCVVGDTCPNGTLCNETFSSDNKCPALSSAGNFCCEVAANAGEDCDKLPCAAGLKCVLNNGCDSSDPDAIHICTSDTCGTVYSMACPAGNNFCCKPTYNGMSFNYCGDAGTCMCYYHS